MKLPLPQYSSSRSPSVEPAATRKGGQQAGQQASKQAVQFQQVQLPKGSTLYARTCYAARPAEHVLAHAAVGLAEAGLYLQLLQPQVVHLQTTAGGNKQQVLSRVERDAKSSGWVDANHQRTSGKQSKGS